MTKTSTYQVNFSMPRRHGCDRSFEIKATDAAAAERTARRILAIEEPGARPKKVTTRELPPTQAELDAAARAEWQRWHDGEMDEGAPRPKLPSGPAREISESGFGIDDFL
jgi:hypothetical protein